jgi:acetate kinase
VAVPFQAPTAISYSGTRFAPLQDNFHSAMTVLTLNVGSNSLKFDVVSLERNSTPASQGHKLFSGILEGIGEKSVLSLLNGKDIAHQEDLPARDLSDAVQQTLHWMEKRKTKAIPALADIDLVGHRVVHGADRFTKAALLDDEVMAGIEALAKLAPLHNIPALEAIRATRKLLGSKMPMVAAFDTVFHLTMPAASYTYAIPFELAQKHRIRRYGFHGCPMSICSSGMRR